MWRNQWPTKLARRIKAAVRMQARFRGKRDRKKWKPILRVSTNNILLLFVHLLLAQVLIERHTAIRY
jgi:hypothetical protein